MSRRPRRPTPGEARYPATPIFAAVAEAWQRDYSAILLDLVWRGYDLLYAEILSHIDLADADEELERSITQYLEPRIRRAMTGMEPFFVQHVVREYESRLPPPAQAPEYDIAFVLYHHPRTAWPLEAKMLRTPGAIADYVNDLREQFLTCRYAPFSDEAAMLGYLLSGDPIAALDNIAARLGCTLAHHPSILDRMHRTSDHVRGVPPGKSYPPSLRCHHLIFELTRRP